MANLTLIESLGIGGFILGILNLVIGGFNLYLFWAKHRKDKPIIKIEKNSYNKHKVGYNLSPVEYVKKLENGKLNYDNLANEIRELIVDITNEGHRDAELKGVLPEYEEEGRNNFSPKVINFHPTAISAGDRELVHLFFEFPTEVIKRIEKKLPYIINVEFDFAHKKIKEKFSIGSYKEYTGGGRKV